MVQDGVAKAESTRLRSAADGRYLTLDAMRGIAAATVAVYHFRREAAPEAYLAVDFFFALSGFVLTKAYADRLKAGASVSVFMKQRVVRLYPLFLAGIGFGLLWRLARAAHSPAGVDWLQLSGSAVANLLMLPSPFDVTLYPFDYAFWSIGAELFINMLFAAWLVRSSRWVNLVLVGASAAALLILVRPPEFANGGVGWATIDLAIARTLFSFMVGSVLATLVRHRGCIPSFLVVPLLLVLGAVLLASPSRDARLMFDLAAIIVGFPVLLCLGAMAEPAAQGRRAAALLGDISYPLYAVHAPIGLVFFYLGWRLRISASVLLAAYLVAAGAAAVLLERWWDRPVRRRLAAGLKARGSVRRLTL